MTTDRGRSIERLLRQARSTDAPAPAGDCPDAETLAALADDTLPAAARREVEGHVASCHRCQALTAAVARADAPVSTAAGDMPAWRRRALNWLVPAAAAATAVALWVLVPGQRTPLSTEPTSERQIAEVPPPALPPPSSEVISSEPLNIPVDVGADEQARERDTNAGAPVAAPASPPPAAAAPAEPSLRAEVPVSGGLPPSREASASAQASADRSANQGQASGPERRNEAALSETVAVQQERALNRQAAPAAAVGAAADAAAARTAGSFEVVSPNPRIRWRVGPGSVVQYSADGGATWATQQTGASGALTAGSAPVPEVSWLVGRAGLVLRTTDAGRQWQRVPFPETVDLTAITASSASSATVLLADGRRFATNDGGVLWIPMR